MKKPLVISASSERGTASLTAVLILALLALFTAATLSKVTTEAVVMGNDYSNTKAFYAAQASLELMSRNFNKIFDSELQPTPADLQKVMNTKPNFDGFVFVQNVAQSGTQDTKPIDSGDFAGLISLRTPYKLDATATYPNGSQVQLTRTFYNHEIPIFQFGIFYNDDMEFHPGPTFDFGGRVHSNANIFMMSGDTGDNTHGLFFRSRVTAAGEIVRDTARNGVKKGGAGWQWDGNVWVADASGNFQSVSKGSVIGGPDIKSTVADMPDGVLNSTWTATDSKPFNGNLVAEVRPLKLPIQINGNSDPIELLRRGKNANDFEVTTLGRAIDDDIMRGSRYFSKPGIRVCLSDSQAELPGGGGGIRLDGAENGLGGDSGSTAAPGDLTRGYKPASMNGGAYQAKRFNGNRLYTGASYTTNGMPALRQTWIKVELITSDPITLAVTTVDITPDFLSMGMTQKDPAGLNIGDANAVLKMQRYEMVGPPIRVAAAEINTATTAAVFTSVADPRSGAGTLPVYSYNLASTLNFVATSKRDTSTSPARWKGQNAALAASEGTAHNATDATAATAFEQAVVVGGVTYRVVPFPIEIFNTREGLFNEDLAAAGTPSWTSLYTDGTGGKIPVNGVISMIDIDMINLGRFLAGTWDGQFLANAALPGGSLSSNDLTDNGGSGYIVYVSDRRGDRDDDGEYDMEDIYINADGTPNGTLQPGEDANKDGVLQADYDTGANNNCGEGARYTVSVETDQAAVKDHKYFRRGVRLINGQTLQGTINKGISMSAENGMYVLGNYNATGVSDYGTPTVYSHYTGTQVPASVVGDAITILSTAWKDANSFRNPFNLGLRQGTETTVRAALLMGDTISSLKVAGVPNAGGGDPDLCGGVHNFPRFLEKWGDYLNYSGSLINLFNSRQHNGAHKNGGNTYSPPTRNWVFDSTFLDATRLPPGTPFFQFVQMTGFRQTVRQVS